jgi:hypothetical protein
MSVFQVDATGALVRDAGGFVRTEGLDEIRQGVQTRTLLLRGEVPTDLSRGFPWPALLSSGTPAELLASRLRTYTDQAPGVVEILELTVTEPDDRAVSIAYRARVSLDDLRRSSVIEDSLGLG